MKTPYDWLNKFYSFYVAAVVGTGSGRDVSIYVTGYWKTDHNVTLGQLHFISPANSHTHALSMH